MARHHSSVLDLLLKMLGVPVVVYAVWLLWRLESAASFADLPFFGVQLQARCDLPMVRVRAAAGTLDFNGKAVTVVVETQGGTRLESLGRTVILGKSAHRWIAVAVGEHKGWVRADTVEPIRRCDAART